MSRYLLRKNAVIMNIGSSQNKKLFGEQNKQLNIVIFRACEILKYENDYY